MSTRRKEAGELQLGDRIKIPSCVVELKTWKKVRYYRLPGTKGNLKAVEIEYTDGPLKGHKAVVVFEEKDMVTYILKDPPLKRAIKHIKGKIKGWFTKPVVDKEPDHPLWT